MSKLTAAAAPVPPTGPTSPADADGAVPSALASRVERLEAMVRDMHLGGGRWLSLRELSAHIGYSVPVIERLVRQQRYGMHLVVRQQVGAKGRLGTTLREADQWIERYRPLAVYANEAVPSGHRGAARGVRLQTATRSTSK